GKAACKTALQAIVGLPERDVPLVGMITRISWQKGTDVVLAAIDSILEHDDMQLVMLGVGDPFYEDAYREVVRRHPGKVCALFRFDVPLAHLIEAGSDFFLMPSRYEPCGLSQMYSMAYGTIPIVHKTGGLADSVRPVTKANLAAGQATGIVFSPCDPEALTKAVRRALKLYNTPNDLQAVRETAMRQDFSWNRSAQAYVDLYRGAVASQR
ncbi:MAG TPA: glycosyltransferase, partial [Candidatus Hydrogenedentes bacterium]|nr:glycosyltransferase [Candidatus Hydrogenedentota bacterium]